MLTVAYLANQFPSPVEPYVAEEIEELRRRGVCVVPGSVRKPAGKPLGGGDHCAADIVLLPLQAAILLRALFLCLRRWKRIAPLLARIFVRGREGPLRRGKALLHIWLGACYAVRLKDRRIEHIHAHHGYFGAWIAMTAARLLDVGFSMTLHGSDLLLHGVYLDVKLENCSFCLTVSEYNRRYILEHYPGVQKQRVVVSRLGVELSERFDPAGRQNHGSSFTFLSVGRLQPVKDHAFLVRACAQVRAAGLRFECIIAGEGPERWRLESLIRKYGLEKTVTLVGHVPRAQMASLYARADVVLLTSRSEGIPLVLMEAMARGKIVLAPAITGIPELVTNGRNGFLYEAGSQADFVARLRFIHSLMCDTPGERRHDPVRNDRVRSDPVRHDPPRKDHPNILSSRRPLDWMRHAAQVQVRHIFNRKKNLESFACFFIERVTAHTGSLRHENSLLQQVQLSFQRHRGLPLRTDGVDALAGARGRAVLDGKPAW
jgi:glycosyltransferase involved in cell wall biosynthesis